MGKRPRCADTSLERESNKRSCLRPLATKADGTELGVSRALADTRKSGVFIPRTFQTHNEKRKSPTFNLGSVPKKPTVPNPFKLSTRSAWREKQLEAKKAAEEEQRKSSHTFRPRINTALITKRTAPVVFSGPARKKQVRAEDGKENHQPCQSHSSTTGTLEPNKAEVVGRSPLGTLTSNVATVQCAKSVENNVTGNMLKVAFEEKPVKLRPSMKSGPTKAPVAAPRMSMGTAPRMSTGTTARMSTGTTPRVSTGTTPRVSTGTTPRMSMGITPRMSMGITPRMSMGAKAGADPKPNARLSMAHKAAVEETPSVHRMSVTHKPAKDGKPISAKLSTKVKAPMDEKPASDRLSVANKSTIIKTLSAGRAALGQAPRRFDNPQARARQTMSDKKSDRTPIAKRTRARFDIVGNTGNSPNRARFDIVGNTGNSPNRLSRAHILNRRATAGPAAHTRIGGAGKVPAQNTVAVRSVPEVSNVAVIEAPSILQPKIPDLVSNSLLPTAPVGIPTHDQEKEEKSCEPHESCPSMIVSDPPAPVPPPDAPPRDDPTAGLQLHTPAKARCHSAPVPGTCTRSSSSPQGVQISDDEEDEAAQNYGPDGYCFIQKSDKFCDARYTAIHQLGEGKYSTVWLMYDKDGPYPEYSNFVAVKVGRAMSSDVLPEDIKREANLLHHINTSLDTQDLRYLGTMIDSFIHEGKYGQHACMVFKVLGSQLLRLVYERNEAIRDGVPLDMHSVMNIFRCILHGTEGFHKHNIVHTDLKPENILLAVPDDKTVELMKTFAQENGLPPPCLDDRHPATVTPYRSAQRSISIPSQTSTPPKRSDSVDPLDFWNNHSPTHEADAAAPSVPLGRPTMMVRKGGEDVEEADSKLAWMPSITSGDFQPSQGMAAVPPVTAKPTEGSSLSTPPVPVISISSCVTIAGPRSPHATATPTMRHQTPRLQLTSEDNTADSPPNGLSLKAPFSSKSPFQKCYLAVKDSPGTRSACTPKTPEPASPRVNPCTPQYVLDQGKGTEVLLGDFGLAMVLEHHHELAPPGVLIYPQDYVVMNHNHGMILQTREYRAPEILLGQDFNVKIDIYSIACIMVELITGEYLWDPKNTIPRRMQYVEQEIDREHLQHMISVMGDDDFPKLRARRTFFRAKFFTASGEPKIPAARKRKSKSRPMEAILAPHVPQPMLKDLSFILTKMLEYHPNDRWSASQCLEYLEKPIFCDLEDTPVQFDTLVPGG